MPKPPLCRAVFQKRENGVGKHLSMFFVGVTGQTEGPYEQLSSWISGYIVRLTRERSLVRPQLMINGFILQKGEMLHASK